MSQINEPIAVKYSTHLSTSSSLGFTSCPSISNIVLSKYCFLENGFLYKAYGFLYLYKPLTMSGLIFSFFAKTIKSSIDVLDVFT